jgi:hypothetical protein
MQIEDEMPAFYPWYCLAIRGNLLWSVPETIRVIRLIRGLFSLWSLSNIIQVA